MGGVQQKEKRLGTVVSNPLHMYLSLRKKVKPRWDSNIYISPKYRLVHWCSYQLSHGSSVTKDARNCAFYGEPHHSLYSGCKAVYNPSYSTHLRGWINGCVLFKQVCSLTLPLLHRSLPLPFLPCRTSRKSC